MRNSACIVRWLLTAVAFTMAVGLAIGTAAIKASSVRERRQIERVREQVYALEATFEFEKAAWRYAVDPERLATRWYELTTRGRE